MKTKTISLLLISFLVLVFSSVLVTAPPVADANLGIYDLNLLTPTNDSYNVNGTVFFTFNVTGNVSSGYVCNLWTNISGSFIVTSNAIQSATNSTVQNFTETNVPDQNIGWTVGCTAPGNSTIVFPGNQSGLKYSAGSSHINYTLRVDKIAPNITINSPLRAGWQTNGTNVRFNLTVQDRNAASCVLESNLNETMNTSATWQTSKETQAYTNGTAFNFTFGFQKFVSGGTDWLENNTGAYLWNVACNDSAGNIARLADGNATFFVDKTAPSRPTLGAPINFTLSTDLTPTFSWSNVSGSSNFSVYEIQLANLSSFATTALVWQFNLSGNASLNITNVARGSFLANLSYGNSYFWRVRAYDLAGNYAEAINNTYRTSSTCGKLYENRWNVCAITNDVLINASSLCSQVGCEFISMYNATHEFQTHTRGSSTNGAMFFVGATQPNASSVVFIYVSSNTSWENRTNDISMSGFYYNLTNVTNSWNVVPQLNQTQTWRLAHIDRSINGNGSQMIKPREINTHNNTNSSKFLSVYRAENQTSTRFMSYASNKTFNNMAIVEYGEVVWVHFSNTTLVWNSSQYYYR